MRPHIEIHVADPSEAASVQAALTSEEERPSAPDPDTITYVAKRGRALAGFAQLLKHPADHFPYEGHWLTNLRVTPWYRGMGIGEELSRRVIQAAKEQGAKEVLLIVTEENRPAVELYRKLGFERALIPRLEERLERERQTTGLRRVIMRKALSG